MRAFIEGLLASTHFADQIVFRHEIPDRAARYHDLTHPLSLQQQAAAARLGVDSLYAHQVEAIEHIRAGRDVAVVTPTASGKSLIYYLPTVESLASGGGHALYLFPTKALEQDQLEKLRVFGRGLFGDRDLSVEIYDGDTPSLKRRKIRAAPPDILITNPEMLHLGLLAYHPEWAGFFRSLRMVVIDELHVYRGVFGNHFAHVLRRLQRITRHYGADPRYLVGSATVGNPETFTRTLLGRPFHVVSESGSPQAGRHFLFVNPTGSPYTVATRLFTDAVRAGYRTIAFTKARRVTELMHSWAAQAGPDVARRIAPYRAGYLPEERREIERRLFTGDLRGVVTTSALELGIDVGGLDVCILVGYPGSVMSSWQRIGRVGRKSGESLVILVAQPDALDQYFMSHPQEFFERGFEPAVVDPENPTVAGAHLVCAGAELAVPREEAESYMGKGGLADLLAAGRMLEDDEGLNLYSLNRRPHREVNLRSGGASYKIVRHEDGRSIGTIDGVRVFHECHEGAVYLHGGTTYRIVRLDEESKRVVAVPFFGDHYTQALGSKETEILDTYRESERNGYRLSFGRLKVTVRITEYAKKRISDQETISKHPLDVPPIVFETVGFWLTLPDALEQECVTRELHFMGGLHGAEHAMISLFPLLALCDRSDIGGISYSRNAQLGAPAIFIYDGYPGGIGLAACVHDRIEELFAATRDLLERCPCDEGCPSCVQSPKCGSGNRPLDKHSARMVLGHLSGEPVTDERVETLDFAPARDRSDDKVARVPRGQGSWRHPQEGPSASSPVPGAGGKPLRDDEGPRVMGEQARWRRVKENAAADDADVSIAERRRAELFTRGRLQGGTNGSSFGRLGGPDERTDVHGETPVRPSIHAETLFDAETSSLPDIHKTPIRSSIHAETPLRPDINRTPIQSSIHAEVPARSDIRAESPSRPDINPIRSTIHAEAPARPAIQPERPARSDIRAESPSRPDIKRTLIRSSIHVKVPARPAIQPETSSWSSVPGESARPSIHAEPLSRSASTPVDVPGHSDRGPRQEPMAGRSRNEPATPAVGFAGIWTRSRDLLAGFARKWTRPRDVLGTPPTSTGSGPPNAVDFGTAPDPVMTSPASSPAPRQQSGPEPEGDDLDPLAKARLRAFVAASGGLIGFDPASGGLVDSSLAPLPVVQFPEPGDRGPGPFVPPRAPIILKLRPGEGRTVVFDVETQRSAEDVGGWDRIRDMGLALAVVLDVGDGTWTTYFERDVERLVMDLVTADRVIGYNSERFDFTVLSGYGRWDLSRIRSFDMMRDLKRRLGFRPKLGDLAQVNLNAGKSADGLQSLEWYKQGRMDLIEEYCRRDVEVTAQLFFGARERRYILIRHHLGAAVRVPVDW